MKKFMLLVSLLAVITFGFSSNVVPVSDAVKVSKNFLSERIGSLEAQNYSIELVYTEYASDGTPVYYRFQVGEKGFIMISATDQVSPVLAYSLESNFQNTPAVSALCENYKSQLSEIVAQPGKTVNKEWNHYLANNFQLRASKDDEATNVEPLVTTTWNQNPFYNSECPYNPRTKFDNDDKRAPVGCVALTMANIMFYYRYPSHGYGSMTYIPREYDDETGELLYTYPVQYANFGQTTYNYDAMPNELNSYNYELARLLYQCGVSANMSYGWDGSGTQSEIALPALQNYFYYAQSAQFKDITDVVTDTNSASQISQWEGLLVEDLNAHRPIFYSGRSAAAGGHAWIVDGYTTIDSTRYFHVNWGWGGSDNGFYRLRNMRTSGYGNFNYQFSESMMYHLCPGDSVAIQKPTSGSQRVTSSQGTISDGAGNVKYQPNTNRSWVMAAPDARAYKFKFSKLKLSNGDKVIIYNGGTEASGIKQEYTGIYKMAACNDYSPYSGSTHGDFPGQNLPNEITVIADSVLIVFISNDDEATDYGFVLDYDVTTFYSNSTKCDQITGYANVYSGVITDKKNNVESDETYRPSTVCQHRLYGLVYGTGYDIAFPKFDLKAGDYVEFYNLSSDLPESPDGRDFIVRYDINNMPNGVINIPVKDLFVRFVSDNWKEGTGFKMEFSGRLGIDQNSNFEDVSIYPNPATDNLFVELTAEEQYVAATVVDLTGKVVYTEQFNHAGGEHLYTLPVSSLANGIYFLNLQGKNGGKVTYKFIVK